jgi:hypothetical protein
VSLAGVFGCVWTHPVSRLQPTGVGLIRSVLAAEPASAMASRRSVGGQQAWNFSWVTQQGRARAVSTAFSRRKLVAKHAQASAVQITVSRGAKGALVEVADDGVGGADDAGGSGLRGLADRVEAMGGQLRISSPPGTGTTISAVIPCGS